MIYLPPKHFEVLITANEIRQIISRLALEIIANTPKNVPLMLMIVLKGASPFGMDLMREIAQIAPHLDLRINFIGVSSYSGTKSTGKIEYYLKPVGKVPLNARIVIIEDIVDTGRTLTALLTDLEERYKREISTCTFLDKTNGRESEFINLTAQYTGQEIENLFVVGYGLDHNEWYRQLPDVRIFPDN